MPKVIACNANTFLFLPVPVFGPKYKTAELLEFTTVIKILSYTFSGNVESFKSLE